MENRCNQLPDCRDQSDEKDCNILILERGYNKYAPPIDDHDWKTNVLLSIDLLKLVDISMKMTAQSESSFKSFFLGKLAKKLFRDHRCTMGLKCKELAEQNLCFSSNNLTTFHLLHFWVGYIQFFAHKKIGWHWRRKSDQNFSKCKAGLVEQQSFVRWKFRPFPEKKLNSTAERDRGPGGIEVYKLRVVFRKYLCTSF